MAQKETDTLLDDNGEEVLLDDTGNVTKGTKSDSIYPLNKPGYDLSGKPVNINTRPDYSMFDISEEAKNKWRNSITDKIGQSNWIPDSMKGIVGTGASFLGAELPLTALDMLSAPESVAAPGLVKALGRKSPTINTPLPKAVKALPEPSYIEAPPVPIDRPLGRSVDINQPSNTVRNIRNQGKFAKQGEFLQQPDGSYLDVNTRKVYDSSGKLIKQGAGKTVELTGNVLDDAGEVISPTTATRQYTPADYATDNAFMKARGQTVPPELEALAKGESVAAAPTKSTQVNSNINPVTGKPRVPTTQDLLDQAMGLGKRLMNEEEGSLDLSGFTNLFKATEDPIHNIKQAVIQAALKGGRVDLSQLSKQFEGKVRPEEFDKAVKDVIKSGGIQKAQGRVFKTLDDVVANVNRRTDIDDAAKAKLIERINAKNVSPNGEVPNNPNIFGRINNETKTILTAYDLSAPGRQGKMLWNTKAYWTSFDDMFKAWGSEKAYEGIKDGILSRPLFADTFLEDGTKIPSIARKSGLELPDILNSREERFAAGFAEKYLPGVKASERAYTGFLNKLRADHFETLVNNAKKQGLEMTPKLLEDIADTINQATGRGNLKDFLKSAETLNAHMFAPKYTASRFRVLDPRYYYKLEPFARKEALKQIASLAGLSTAMNGLYQLAGAETKMNPFSDSIDSEFMKGKFGNTRIDPNAGVQQPYVLANRLIQNSYDMYVNGNRGDYGKFKKATPIDTAFNFALNKLNPVESTIAAMLRGTDFDYQPFELKKAMLNRTVPIMMQDMYELYNEDPSLLPFLAPQAILGDSLQTYTK